MIKEEDLAGTCKAPQQTAVAYNCRLLLLSSVLFFSASQTVHPVHPADTVDLSSAVPLLMTNTAKSCPITIDGASVTVNTWITTIIVAGITTTMKVAPARRSAQLVVLIEAVECPEWKIQKKYNQVF